MAVIRRADADTLAREAIVLDLAEIGLQAERMLDVARREAERVVAEAHTERRRLTDTAAKEGFAKGHAEGLVKGVAEGAAKGQAEARAAAAARIDALLRQWSDGLGAFEGARDEMLVQSRTDVLALALAAARKIVKRSLACDPGVVGAQIEACVARVVGASRMTIAVHPEDLEAAAADVPAILERLGATAHAAVVADPGLTRGSCAVRTARGRVEADIELQLQRLVETLLPCGAPPADGPAPTDQTEAPGSEPAP